MEIVTGRLATDEAQQEARLRAQAFQIGLGPYYDPDRPAPDNDRVHVARAGGKVVAAVTVLPSGQWFGGRSLPMGGVSGVTVAPEARGKGVARQLLGESIEAMYQRGEIISSLFPTTSTLYRSMGYEFAGRWERTTVDLSEIAAVTGARTAGSGPGRNLTIEALAPGELERMRPLYDLLAAESNGWLDRQDLFWAKLNFSVNPDRSNSFGYVIVDGGEVVGGLTVGHISGEHHLRFDVEVGGPFAASAEALTKALGMVADLSTTAQRATLSLPVETLALSLPGAILDHRDSWLWMLRLVDVEAALTARGYNPRVEADFQFRLVDEVAPWNNGHWMVRVSGGSAGVERRTGAQPGTGDGVMELDVATLSCLFTGFVGPEELGRAGRLPGADSDAIAGLAAAFGGQAPRLVDFF